jgi:hypothetical protein
VNGLVMKRDDRRLRSKNLALLGVLVAVIVLLYALAMVRISAQL